MLFRSVEFKDRATLQSDPVKDLREFGTHHQPRGTWSDDGAMILCTTDSLVNHEFDLADMGQRFVRWMKEGLWTANGDVFDVGGTTAAALLRIAKGVSAEQAGGQTENSNGNGSLMRIIPVVLRFATAPLGGGMRAVGALTKYSDRLESASAITHGHPRSRMACVFYGLLVRQLLANVEPPAALAAARTEFKELYERAPEFSRFRPILGDDFTRLPEAEIVSTGYVLHTLHASIWCLLTTRNFPDCLLKAVNLGGDSDTTGCVAGGLAGAMYGIKSIPPDWRNQLARKGDVDCLFREFADLSEETAN